MLNYYARGAGLDLGPAFQPRHPRCQPTQKLRASCALVPSVHSALTVKQFLAMAILAGPLQHWLWGFLQALYLLGQLVGLPVPGAAANLWHSLQGLAVVPSLPHWVMAFTTMEALTPQPVFQSPTTVARHRWHWAHAVDLHQVANSINSWGAMARDHVLVAAGEVEAAMCGATLVFSRKAPASKDGDPWRWLLRWETHLVLGSSWNCLELCWGFHWLSWWSRWRSCVISGLLRSDQIVTIFVRFNWVKSQLVFATLQFFSPSCDAFFVLWFSIALHLTLSTSMSNRYLVDFGYFHIWCLRIDFEWCFRIDREHILTGM